MAKKNLATAADAAAAAILKAIEFGYPKNETWHRNEYVVGHGYDIHRLAPLDVPPELGGATGPLIVGSVQLMDNPACPTPDTTANGTLGVVAHSDGDVVLHSVCDAILGAVGLGDIGELFPDVDRKWKKVASSIFVKAALDGASKFGLYPANVDITLVLEKPRLGNAKIAIRRALSEILALPLCSVALKAKTHERLGYIGAGKALECHTVLLLRRIESQ